jgi:hypothetical protein
MSPGTAESTGAGFSVGEAPGAAAVDVVAGVVAAGVDGVVDLGAVLAQAPRKVTRATRARIRWVVFMPGITFVMAG